MVRAVIFDLDGTIYVGKDAVEGVKESIEKLRSQKIKTLFLTNSSTKDREKALGKLSKICGIEAKKEEMYTSSYFLAKHINENYKDKKIFWIGEEGIKKEFENFGIETVKENADVVCVGLDYSINYDKLERTLREINNGADLVVSNKDVTYPSDDGLKPGSGAIVAAVEAMVGEKAYVVGKPNCNVLKTIEKEHRLRNKDVLMVGDRLDTDIRFANKCGIKSALVLTGVTSKEDLRRSDIEPDYIFESVTEINYLLNTLNI